MEKDKFLNEIAVRKKPKKFKDIYNALPSDLKKRVYNLKNYASPGDLLAFVIKEKNFLVINCSKSDLDKLLNIESKFYKKFFCLRERTELDYIFL